MLSKHCVKTRDCFCVLHCSIIMQNLNGPKKRNLREVGIPETLTLEVQYLYGTICLCTTASSPVGNKVVLSLLGPSKGSVELRHRIIDDRTYAQVTL